MTDWPAFLGSWGPKRRSPTLKWVAKPLKRWGRRPATGLGNVFPPVNERRLVDLCCEMIGLTDWIRDGLRKNCATHLRAVYKNDYGVVKDMGNSVRILLKHYAALHVPESVSLEYWRISPEKVKAYLKTYKWKKVVEEAAKVAAAKATAATSAAQPKP